MRHPAYLTCDVCGDKLAVSMTGDFEKDGKDTRTCKDYTKVPVRQRGGYEVFWHVCTQCWYGIHDELERIARDGGEQ